MWYEKFEDIKGVTLSSSLHFFLYVQIKVK
jgi:hypothetical protein